LLPDGNPESDGRQQTGDSTKEKATQKDGVIKMTTRRPRRKKQSESEFSGADKATRKILEKSTAAPPTSQGSET
jgi:polyribonucleotide nucleotidyltransferase